MRRRAWTGWCAGTRRHSGGPGSGPGQSCAWRTGRSSTPHRLRRPGRVRPRARVHCCGRCSRPACWAWRLSGVPVAGVHRRWGGAAQPVVEALGLCCPRRRTGVASRAWVRTWRVHRLAGLQWGGGEGVAGHGHDVAGQESRLHIFTIFDSLIPHKCRRVRACVPVTLSWRLFSAALRIAESTRGNLRCCVPRCAPPGAPEAA